jgi:hypothetical protein
VKLWPENLPQPNASRTGLGAVEGTSDIKPAKLVFGYSHSGILESVPPQASKKLGQLWISPKAEPPIVCATLMGNVRLSGPPDDSLRRFGGKRTHPAARKITGETWLATSCPAF